MSNKNSEEIQKLEQSFEIKQEDEKREFETQLMKQKSQLPESEIWDMKVRFEEEQARQKRVFVETIKGKISEL